MVLFPRGKWALTRPFIELGDPHWAPCHSCRTVGARAVLLGSMMGILLVSLLLPWATRAQQQASECLLKGVYLPSTWGAYGSVLACGIVLLRRAQ